MGSNEEQNTPISSDAFAGVEAGPSTPRAIGDISALSIAYDATPEDIVTAALHYCESSIVRFRLWWWGTAIAHLLIVGLWLVAVYTHGIRDRVPSGAIILLMVSVLILLVQFSPWFRRRMTRISVQKFLEKDPDELLGPHSLSIGPGGIRVTGSSCETVRQWHSVDKLEVTKHHAFIYCGGQIHYRIPMRAFSSPLARGKFLFLVKQYLELSRETTAQRSTRPPVDANLLRRNRLTAERTVRQGTLCLVGLYIVLGTISIGTLCSSIEISLFQYGVTLGMACTLTVGAAAGLVVNWGVRRQATWSRKPLTILAIGSLLFFPIGTVLAIDLLRALYTGPAPRPLSREYAGIVQKTGAMTQRTSILTWVVLGLICLLVIATIVVANLPPEYRRPP